MLLSPHRVLKNGISCWHIRTRVFHKTNVDFKFLLINWELWPPQAHIHARKPLTLFTGGVHSTGCHSACPSLAPDLWSLLIKDTGLAPGGIWVTVLATSYLHPLSDHFFILSLCWAHLSGARPVLDARPMEADGFSLQDSFLLWPLPGNLPWYTWLVLEAQASSSWSPGFTCLYSHLLSANSSSIFQQTCGPQSQTLCLICL